MADVDDHQIDIVALAWPRELGLPDLGLISPGTRQIRVDENADRVRFLRLAGTSALVGPTWAIERPTRYSDDELSSGAAMLAITKDHGGSDLGVAVAVAQPPGEHRLAPAGRIARLRGAGNPHRRRVDPK